MNTAKTASKATRTGKLYLAENFYSLAYPHFRYLYETEPFCNGKKAPCCSVIGQFRSMRHGSPSHWGIYCVGGG